MRKTTDFLREIQEVEGFFAWDDGDMVSNFDVFDARWRDYATSTSYSPHKIPKTAHLLPSIMKSTNKFLIAAASLMALSVSSQAAVVISQFNFTGNSGASSDTETITNTSNITAGAGISGSLFANDRLEVRGNQNTISGSTNNTLASQQPPAITANEYITFTVTVPVGQVMSLTTLSYTWATQNAYRQSYGIYTDKTGFTYANILDGQHASGSAGTGGSMTAFTARSIDLSGIASLQDLTDTTVEFRFYITHPQSASNLRAWAFDDIQLSGTVEVIPEPTTALLGGLGMLALLRRRR